MIPPKTYILWGIYGIVYINCLRHIWLGDSIPEILVSVDYFLWYNQMGTMHLLRFKKNRKHHGGLFHQKEIVREIIPEEMLLPASSWTTTSNQTKMNSVAVYYDMAGIYLITQTYWYFRNAHIGRLSYHVYGESNSLPGLQLLGKCSSGRLENLPWSSLFSCEINKAISICQYYSSNTHTLSNHMNILPFRKFTLLNLLANHSPQRQSNPALISN